MFSSNQKMYLSWEVRKTMLFEHIIIRRRIRNNKKNFGGEERAQYLYIFNTGGGETFNWDFQVFSHYCNMQN